MSFAEITGGFKNQSPGPDIGYQYQDNGQPWPSLSAAHQGTPAEYRAIGKSRFIDDGSGLKEYWYKGGVTIDNLVPRYENLETPQAFLNELNSIKNATSDMKDQVAMKLGDMQQIVTNGYTPKGSWNVQTNSPDLGAVSKTGGDAYVVKGPGTTNITGEPIEAIDGDVFYWNATDSKWIYFPKALAPGKGTVSPESTTFVVDSDNGYFIVRSENGNIGLLLTPAAVLKLLSAEIMGTLKVNGSEIIPSELVKIADFNVIKAIVDILNTYVNSNLQDDEFVIDGKDGNIGLRLNSEGLHILRLILGSNVSIQEDSRFIIAAKDDNDVLGFFVTRDSKLGVKSATVENLVVSGTAQIPGLTECKYPRSFWKGKRILVLGTSIPAGGLYPGIAATQNGATIINKAVGSSSVRKAKTDGTVNGCGWETITRALSHTIAEKQTIIDNWDSYKTILTGSPPATLTQSQKEFILSCSFENSLLPYLNGTYQMPDLFVFDHGHNDMFFPNATEETYTQFPPVRNDRNYFLGASNFIFDLIYQYNPHARIVISGHYENIKKPRIAEAQAILANYWGVPILKLWERTGWSQQKAPGSAALWAQTPYNSYTSGQNTSADMTVENVWLPDRLHPHTDSSGRAQALLGDIVGEFLSNLF